MHLLPVGSTPAIIDDPNNRIPEEKDRALQAIIFTAFAIEYRLKRVLQCTGKLRTTSKKEDSLKSLINGFWKRLSTAERFDGRGNCTRPEPSVWTPIQKKLLKLADLRDFIAHARYEDILSYCSEEPVEQRARDFYINIVEAIKIINVCTGDEQREKDQLDEYFHPLMTRAPKSMKRYL